MKKPPPITRRDFITTTAASAAAITMAPAFVRAGQPANERLNIAGIGCGGRGAKNLEMFTDENMVALCDVDTKRAAKTRASFPEARTFTDFRRMFDTMDSSIDAVVVSTPDHTHAVAAMEAIRRRKHVYCEKPLAHSIHEVRALTEAARRQGVQTQMGNQGHSSEHIRLLCEWVWSGAIGEVREVYAWSSRPSGGAAFPVNLERPSDTPPVPDALDWDLWLGPAPYRPYHPAYLPFTWRGWVDFGTGALGDMGCHILDPSFWALKLGEAATVEVEATTTHFDPAYSSETFPTASIVRYSFPARAGMPPLRLTWSDGRLRPPRIPDMGPDRKIAGEGAVLVGEHGSILHGSHGAGGARIIPEEKMRAYLRNPAEKTLLRSAGHHKDWVLACKGGKPASASFDYGGPLTEMALLGTLAIRMQNRLLRWDAKSMRVTNAEDAETFVRPTFREGWTLS